SVDRELAEVEAFVAAQAPFDQLDAHSLTRFVRTLTVRYVRRGSTILTIGDPNHELYLLRSGAVELHDDTGVLITQLCEGACFGYPSLLTRGVVERQVKALEDTLLYCLPEQDFHNLRRQLPSFDQFFSEAHAERVRQALSDFQQAQPLAPASNQLMTLPLKELVVRSPVNIDPHASVQTAAIRMTDTRVSSLLVVEDGRLQGILTDRDVRSRIVAAGRSLDTPVHKVMTPNPITMPAGALAFEALMTMTHYGIHHLPVVEAVLETVSEDAEAISEVQLTPISDDDTTDAIDTDAINTNAINTANSSEHQHLESAANITVQPSSTTSKLGVPSVDVSNEVARGRLQSPQPQLKVIGLVTTTDIVRQESDNPVYLVGDIRKQPTVEALAALAKRRKQVFNTLISADATAYDIGRVMTLLADATAQQLLRLAEAKLGPPPVAYAWLVFGSQARSEQSLHTDQDNALLLDVDYDETNTTHSSYFANLAQFMCHGLHTCGYDYCPGEVMATNPRWRQDLPTWLEYFSMWTHQPQPEALLNASIFFDLRAIYGKLELAEILLNHIRERTDEPLFLGYMAKNALGHQPPLGFFRKFVLERGGEHNKTLDMKHRGVVPIIDLARVYALSAGVTAMNTRERLEAAARQDALSDDGMANLRDALEFIAFVRLRHQAGQLRQGQTLDNYLAPDGLSQFERNHLKDAFQIVNTMQNALDMRYQAGRLG
ncbi:MAG: putative nucleotidyltransferase substrate binding domain-containing protein, partial [Deinococcota bacterium]